MPRPPAIVWAILVLALLGLVFPPFHVRSRKAVQAAQTSAQFNPTNFVAAFWQEKLLPAAHHAPAATDAAKLVAAIALSPAKAHEQFGRSIGIGSTYYYFLRGSGRVVSVSNDSLGLSLKDAGDGVDISVPLGLVFGNALRDGTGLLNSSDYPSSQDFNDLAAGLNHLVETQVLPPLPRLRTGARVQFAGCVEVADEDEDLKPLKLVPIFVQTE